MKDFENKSPRLFKPRKRILTTPESMTNNSFLNQRELPIVVESLEEGVSLAEWLKASEEKVQEMIARYGAVLFRGFSVKTAADFNDAVVAVSGNPLEYVERSSPRKIIEGSIYTSTEHPADQEIFPHNEQSYNLTVPLKIFFYCETPASLGGATPLTDVRAITRKLCPNIRDRFNQKKYMYVRNYSQIAGLTWQEAYQTDRKTEVEAYCRSQDIQFEWLCDDRLRTRQIREPMIINPLTGQLLWFNHITFFNIGSLPTATRESLLASFELSDLPNNTYYGDGQPIEPEVLEQLRAAYRSETSEFQWRAGDVLVVDNLSIAHSRSAFTGPRKVLVAMAESHQVRKLYGN